MEGGIIMRMLHANHINTGSRKQRPHPERGKALGHALVAGLHGRCPARLLRHVVVIVPAAKRRTFEPFVLFVQKGGGEYVRLSGAWAGRHCSDHDG